MNINDILESIKNRLGEYIIEAKAPRDKRIYLKVRADKLIDAAKILRDEFNFDMPISSGGTDYPKRNVIELFWAVWSSEKNIVLILKCDVDRGEPRVSSLVDIWPGIQKFERETWELIGVMFDGHPRLKPLLLPEDWTEGYPLRKDFNLDRYKVKWGDL